MRTIRTQPWDAAAHLRTEEDMIAYLDAVLAESDPELAIAALNDIARAQGKPAVVADTLLTSKVARSSPSSDLEAVLRALDELGLRFHVTPASRT